MPLLLPDATKRTFGGQALCRNPVVSLRVNKKEVAAIPAVKRPQVYSQKRRLSNPVLWENLMSISRHVYNSNYKNEASNDIFVRTVISVGLHFRFSRRLNLLARMLKKVVLE